MFISTYLYNKLLVYLFLNIILLYSLIYNSIIYKLCTPWVNIFFNTTKTVAIIKSIIYIDRGIVMKKIFGELNIKTSKL